MSGAATLRVEEVPLPGDVPLWTHPEWAARFPWLAQGVTGRGSATAPFDLGLFGSQPVGEVLGRWRKLGEAVGVPAIVHSHQVHRTEVRVHNSNPSRGLLVLHGFDGHATRFSGLLLTASVADCVPVSIVDEELRVVAILHAGWRGVAAGFLGSALTLLAREMGSRSEVLWVHLGPGICGSCYEVGPEVHEAVHPDRDPPDTPAPIDLREALIEQASAAGIAPARISSSAHCTLCGPGEFFSHRGGSGGRQMAFVGVRRES